MCETRRVDQAADDAALAGKLLALKENGRVARQARHGDRAGTRAITLPRL